MNAARYILLGTLLLGCAHAARGQEMRADTYCNPLNIDYTYMIYNSDKDLSYRSGADPAVVKFRDVYYLFVTRSMGYWYSYDLLHWHFIRPAKWYFQGSNAPAAFNYRDSVLYVTGDPSGSMSILYTDNPMKGDWHAVPSILNDLQDPALFIDDDGQAYVFWGSSNVYPIRGRKLDRERRFLPQGDVVPLFGIDMAKHGWERFGENHTDTVTGGYIEGPWLTKHNGKYYMQYAAPGTEFNVYADGVYVADAPLGPYTYAPNNPISYKPGGFMNGAGHGSTVVGPGGAYWHFASMSLSYNVNWERRLCMFPTFFDADGLMWVDTNFGDYPHYAPDAPGKQGQFTGWMLLSYRKPVVAASFEASFPASNVTDEDVKTFWLATRNDDAQTLTIDLLAPAAVHAVQVNYFDYKTNRYGRTEGLRYRYTVEGSMDGSEWFPLVDRAGSYKDTPNDYVQLATPRRARYVRYRNIETPTPYLALSDIRVFGIGEGKKPQPVRHFQAVRQADRRDALLRWTPRSDSQGYNIRWGIAPDKLYNSWLVYGADSLLLKSLTTSQSYYFTIEAFNENGLSPRSQPLKVE